MTSPRSGSPTRVLVLGGGGAVGVGWQAGLLTGLREAGVDLAGAEAVVGTSAGAFVGALLSGGQDVIGALTALTALGQSIDLDALAAGSETFLSARRQASLATHPQQALKAIGQAAREAHTLDEHTYLGLFDALDNAPWPAGFRCTAVDTETGNPVVWERGAGASLLHAVASSCVVPGLFPPVTINGRHYMDGGILNHLNAAAAPPADALVALSCHPLGPRSTEDDSAPTASHVGVDDELAELGKTAHMALVTPDFSRITYPANMMDLVLAAHAFQVGEQQAAQEAAVIQALWTR
jgi:NTE family protein